MNHPLPLMSPLRLEVAVELGSMVISMSSSFTTEEAEVVVDEEVLRATATT